MYAHENKVKKVKCTLVQALRLCTGRTAHRGSRGIALPFLDRGTRREWGVIVTTRSLFTPWRDPVPIVQEAGWAPGPIWRGAENLAPTGIRSPDRPVHSQLLHRLRYPAHTVSVGTGLELVCEVYIIKLWLSSTALWMNGTHFRVTKVFLIRNLLAMSIIIYQ